MIKLVYIVTYEEYHEWEIEAVFMEREPAVSMARTLNSRMIKAGACGNRYNVQVWDTEKQTMEFIDLENNYAFLENP